MAKSIMKINEHGDKEWYLNDLLHRENDLPAVEKENGAKQWYYNGELHRENRPAIERANGTKEWYLNDIEDPELENILKAKKHLGEILSKNENPQSKRKI